MIVRQNQAVYAASGEMVVQGRWDPRVMVQFCRTEEISGKHILDIGSNRGGLSLELARLGGHIYAADPVDDLSAAKEISNNEKLEIEFGNQELFESHTLGQFDVVVCFGLIYHFRNPIYVLDYLPSLQAPILYISTQTSPGDELKLENRARGNIPKERDMAHGARGWQPTYAMFYRMLESSGFGNIELLTDRPYSFPEKPPGATNSAYYRADLHYPVEDPQKLNEVFEARWGLSEPIW